MTPADRAMRDAFDEGVQQARSPARMASTLRPLLDAPRFDLTSFRPSGPQPPKIVDQSLEKPANPHTPRDQFQQYHHSPWSSSTPSEYKRVRRKQSSFDLSGPPRDLDDWPLSSPSFSPYLPSSSPEAYFSRYQPPPPLLPPFRSSPTSPSLSSTVDTLPSTSPRTPFQRVELPFDQWSSGEPSELSEKFRTKRKFPQLKVAKRLPHPAPSHYHGGDGTWEVHAAVIDLGEIRKVESDSSEYTVREHVIRAEESSPPRPSTAGKKGRSVRFEDASAAKHNRSPSPSPSLTPPFPPSPLRPNPTEHTASDEHTQSSSYTLSKFKFPAPPGYTWAGTFGHLTETPPPTSPASPATLHYRGASFDVVNPHASLLLGYTDFETPAEIDGLLDDYFNRSTLSLNMSGNRINEASTSQVSLNTSTSSSRQRVLYDDAMSARRNIMNLPQAPSQQRNTSAPNVDSPTLPASNQSIAQLSRVYTAEPQRGDLGSGGLPYLPRSRFADDGYESTSLAGRTPPAQDAGEAAVETPHSPVQAFQQSGSIEPMVGTVRRTPFGSFRTTTGASRNRASSVYPPTELSDPFDLESRAGNDHNSTRLSNIGDSRYNDDNNFEETRDITDARHGAGRDSYYDDGHDTAHEDEEGEAYATQSTIDPDTVANFVGLYEHNGWIGSQQTNVADNTGSVSVEGARGSYRTSGNPYYGAYNHTQLGGRAVTGGYGQMHMPPARLPPTPQHPSHPFEGFNRFRSVDSDLPTTDQTYGNTTPLLGLTPRPGAHRRGLERIHAPSHRLPSFEIPADDDAIAPPEPRDTGNPFRARRDENKENIAPSFSSVSLSDSDVTRQSEDITAHSLGDVRRHHHLLLAAAPSTTLPQSAEQIDDAASAWEDASSLEEGAGSPSHRSARTAASGPVAGLGERMRAVGRGISQIFASPRVDDGVVAPAAQSAGRRGSFFGGDLSHQQEVVAILLRNANHTAGAGDMHRLEVLRRQDPAAHRGGVVAAERALAAEQRRDERRGGSKPHFLTHLLRRPAASPEEETLLPSSQHQTPRPGGLQYSETAGTFATIRLPSAPTAHAALRIPPSLPPLPSRCDAPATFEMTPPPPRKPRSSRPATTGQRVLLPLSLGDGTVPTLHPPRGLPLRRRQVALSKPWLRLCGLCPVTAVVFGLGGFDFWMRRTTGGEIREMDPEAKRAALWVWVPLGVIAWAILGCVVAIAVLAGRL